MKCRYINQDTLTFVVDKASLYKPKNTILSFDSNLYSCYMEVK